MLGQGSGGGLILPPNTFTTVHRNLIVKLVARHRVPAIYGSRNFRDEGGLIFYGANPVDQFRQAATYVDRILRGEKPGDLPIQEPTQIKLAINLRTARAIKLIIPPTVLARADEVIE